MTIIKKRKRRQTRAYGIYLICRRLCHSVDIYRLLINISETSNRNCTHLYSNIPKIRRRKRNKSEKNAVERQKQKKIIQPERQKHFKMCFSFFQQTVSAFICYNILNRNDLRLHCFEKERERKKKKKTHTLLDWNGMLCSKAKHQLFLSKLNAETDTPQIALANGK